WIAWPCLGVAQVGLLVITHAGINAAALSSLAPSVWGYLAYMGLDVLSLFILAVLKGGMAGYEHLMALLLGVYLVTLTVLSIQNHRSQVAQVLSSLKLKDLSLRDMLTGLRNRRYLTEFMGPEAESVLRSWTPGSPIQQSLAIVMLDLDHFKRVNDAHGHQAGDAVLKQVAVILEETLRKQDLVIRWGGEEFLLVARGADRSYALMLAERIREKVVAHAFLLPDGTQLRKTCSLGYSLFPFSPEAPRLLTWEQVLGLADACLYRAKTAGRDRAVGAFPGGKAWEGDVPAQLDGVERDLGAAAQAGLIRLMGELS
ncbi:MAG TPA: GGDEF domain-containing protein, partial [Holophagaceae bacterium]|nr:GGDEF domain-containing protein [Holophagaceae bacterium]